MKVVCQYISIDEMPPELTRSLTNLDRLRAICAHRPRVTHGKSYTVYGVSCAEGNVWYDIVDDDAAPYPVSVLAAIFRVSDGRPSRLWVCRFNERGSFFLWPVSWYEDFYHDRLSEGDKKLVADFHKVKAEMDAEC